MRRWNLHVNCIGIGLFSTMIPPMFSRSGNVPPKRFKLESFMGHMMVTHTAVSNLDFWAACSNIGGSNGVPYSESDRAASTRT
ncbi:unnamed protein product [Urochloa humidicola]